MDEARPLVGVSALQYLGVLTSVSLITGGCLVHKDLCHSLTWKDSIAEQMVEESQG